MWSTTATKIRNGLTSTGDVVVDSTMVTKGSMTLNGLMNIGNTTITGASYIGGTYSSSSLLVNDSTVTGTSIINNSEVSNLNTVNTTVTGSLIIPSLTVSNATITNTVNAANLNVTTGAFTIGTITAATPLGNVWTNTETKAIATLPGTSTVFQISNNQQIMIGNGVDFAPCSLQLYFDSMLNFTRTDSNFSLQYVGATAASMNMICNFFPSGTSSFVQKRFKVVKISNGVSSDVIPETLQTQGNSIFLSFTVQNTFLLLPNDKIQFFYDGGQILVGSGFGAPTGFLTTTTADAPIASPKLAVSVNNVYQVCSLPTRSTIAGVLLSSDYGQTFQTLLPGTSTDFADVAISGTGEFISCISSSAGIYSISNYGQTYSLTSVPGYAAVGMSRSGQYQYAFGNNGIVNRSLDYGVTWATSTGFINTAGGVITDKAIDASGKYILIARATSPSLVSLDFGDTFSTIQGYNSCCISNSGKYMYIQGDNTNLRVSSDFGLTFGTNSSGVSFSTGLTRLRCDDSGARVYIFYLSNNLLTIYYSNNYGQTFVSLMSPQFPYTGSLNSLDAQVGRYGEYMIVPINDNQTSKIYINTAPSLKIDSDTQVNGNTNVTGTIYSADEIVAFSDIALKTNIVPIDRALDKVCQLQGVTYKRRDIGVWQLGLIAQDVEHTFPQAVTLSPQGYKAVAYQQLIGVLIESIKELRDRIHKLEKKKQRMRL